jgi:hypothetical protein
MQNINKYKESVGETQAQSKAVISKVKRKVVPVLFF